MMERLVQDGVYLVHHPDIGLRRVRVAEEFIPQGGLSGGYYRIVGDDDQPLPPGISLSVRIALQTGATFEPIATTAPAGDLTKESEAVELLLGCHDEVIRWIDPSEATPDEGMIVMLKCVGAPEPVWPGFLENNLWHFIDGSEVTFDVTFWADMPTGPLFGDDEDKRSGVTADLPPRQPLLRNSVAMATSGVSGVGFGEGLRHG
jgi:hypothetical protein